MKHVFYFIGIAFIIYEMLWILNPNVQIEKKKKFTKLSKENKDKGLSDMSDDYVRLLVINLIMAIIMISWFFAGLLTFNWLAFLVFIIVNLTIIAPLSKLLKYSIGYTVLCWLNSVIGFAFGVFVILNSYHLKIDLYEVLLKWLGY